MGVDHEKPCGCDKPVAKDQLEGALPIHETLAYPKPRPKKTSRFSEDDPDQFEFKKN